MKRARIICAVTNDLNQDQRMHRICSSLAKRKYLVTLIGREKPDSRAIPRYRFKTDRLLCRWSKGIRFYVEYNYKLFKYLQKSDYDVVNANDLDTIIACRLSAWIKKKEFVFDAHEIFSLVPELRFRPLRRMIWKGIALMFLKDSKTNYTVNESLKKELEKNYKIEFSVVPNYPKKNIEIKSRTPHTPIRLLYQGMLNKGRGLRPLITAVSNMENCVLYIAGSGVMYDELSRLIDKLDVADRVKLFGFLQPNRLKELTNICDIGINLLDPNSKSYYFSSANKFFDYIASGLPSINMNFPEYKNINDQYDVGLLIDTLNEKEIQQSIELLTQDTQLYNRLSENCLEAHNQLNWQTQEPNVVELYKSVLD